MKKAGWSKRVILLNRKGYAKQEDDDLHARFEPWRQGYAQSGRHL
jgi:hypothetical protein